MALKRNGNWKLKIQRREVAACVAIRSGSLVLLFALFAPPARADNDGFFCSSKGYVALELRSFHTRGLKASHVLRVVRFGSEKGFYPAGEVSLLDFQVQHMECTQDRVRMSGMNKGYTEYTVDISTPNKLKIVDSIHDAARVPSTLGPAPETLGPSLPKTILLESNDPAHRYKLILNTTEERGKDGLERRSTAEIVEVDPHGKISQRLLLYEDHHIVSPD
jgi:hypothetical protein